ncbi:hypothetical protein NE865_03172 [Phthorimaea operculella]|nr:hypothetical protein NE865_03172 [Phthorimaea operculella]
MDEWIERVRASQDKEGYTPPVPIKTYQWEDVRRARKAGAYPWTHLLKAPLEGVVTAEDIIRETTPRRSMSREFSRSRTHSPIDKDAQRILNLDHSPGSSRKHGEEGEDEGVHIPNFSKEISMDSEDDVLNDAVKAYIARESDGATSSRLATPIDIPKNVSPKSILKRRAPEQQCAVTLTETREKTKCCHPLVNKIKHLADKTLQKLDRNESEKSPNAKRKKNEDTQEIRQLKSSPGAVRRQKFSAIKLGDSDEMSKTMIVETPPTRKKKEHIYEDIEDKNKDVEKCLQFSKEVEKQSIEDGDKSNKDNGSLAEKKSNASQDPSLVVEDTVSLKSEEHVMEKLHKKADSGKEALLLDEEMDPDEPNVDEVFQNQFDEPRDKNDSPNITITEILDDEAEQANCDITCDPIEMSPSPSPCEIDRQKNEMQFNSTEWSKPSSDHEYEIIEKPSPNVDYSVQREYKPETIQKTDDELSSTTSLERKYLQPSLDDEEHLDDKENVGDEDISNAEALQRDIEDRFFVNTPSTVSRTECEVSTSQVDSSALENLPLKRGNRSKNMEGLQQRFKEGTGKIKSQAGKLKTKIQNIKTPQFNMPDKPKINLPSRPKFKMPERPKMTFPERPKFDKRKFSLPDRPKFKKINITEKLSFGDRKKFTLPERPKFNVPDLSKFKMPDRPKINFPSLGRKKEYKVENTTESETDLRNVATVDFEAITYPRLFGRKNKSKLPKTSSSPTLNREDTPPATFTFTRVKKVTSETKYIPDSPEHPREYGDVDGEEGGEKQFETTYDFDNEAETSKFNENRTAASIPDMSPSNQEYTHVINEINNDEFFVRPRGISRENIQVREYLSDEIRQAFKIPKNVLASMGSNSEISDKHMYANEPDADPELLLDDNDQRQYSTEDLNERDDGYYTFPPVRPSRAKRKKKEPEQTDIQYIDDSVHASMQFSEVDLRITEEHAANEEIPNENFEGVETDQFDYTHTTDLHSINEYANDDYNEYPEDTPIQSQTLPMPPKRKKKSIAKEFAHSSLTDIKDQPSPTPWGEFCGSPDDIIVYRTEHEYIVPQAETTVITERSPVPPRRNRSRSSRGTSLCDDDRTSHGAESLTLDTNAITADEMHIERQIRDESPGYATVDKGPYAPSKAARRSKSKSPPARRRRKSNSSERKYYTVGSSKALPDRPPRKKSSTSLMTLDSFSKRSVSGDFTQYVEIEEPRCEEVHKDLNSGEILNKMKDRPLPPPPRPPRGPKKERKSRNDDNQQDFEGKSQEEFVKSEDSIQYLKDQPLSQDVVEIEVSTQTDPLPDDVDFELGMDENIDISMSSSLRDIVDEDSISKSHSKMIESPHFSRPTSRSEKSLKLSDPKISELSKSTMGRTSPTVILVERRVSSPTRINEREEMLTEASLTVQHIDIDESEIPDVPPLPKPRGVTSTSGEDKVSKSIQPSSNEQALERVTEAGSRDVQLDNLITQRLQVRDLDVGRLNVSELQASKVLVSDIEGMTLQVAELDSKSGHISVSGIEFSQSVIDEIVKKFAEITTSHAHESSDYHRPLSREEQTQTDEATSEIIKEVKISEEDKKPQQSESLSKSDNSPQISNEQAIPPPPPPRPAGYEDTTVPPQRPPPPDLTPLLYSYLQDISLSPTPFYGTRPLRERPFTEFHESQHHSPPTTSRRPKRKPAAPHTESSSGDERPRPSPRRMPPPILDDHVPEEAARHGEQLGCWWSSSGAPDPR